MLFDTVFVLILINGFLPTGLVVGLIIGLVLVSIGILAYIAYTIYAIIRNRSFSFDDASESDLSENSSTVIKEEV